MLGILGGIGQFAQLYIVVNGSKEFWAIIVSGTLYFISHGALLFGAIKYNPIAVLVNLVCTAIIVVLAIFSIYIIKISIVSGNDPRPTNSKR